MIHKKTETDWTHEHIQKFWDWYSSNPYMQSRYFTYQCRTGIVAFLEATGKLEGKILDYGCGVGYLLEGLLDKDLECYGVDFSQYSISHVN
jgi:2-polyprenyl-3-methyl-5-hydroxy-6-metoxy-1,4-benzoquinol methylase